MIAALTTIEVAAMYSIMSLCFFGDVRMGEEMRYALRLSKASLASSVHLNLPVFFSNLKKGNPFLPSHDMKRLMAATTCQFLHIFDTSRMVHLYYCLNLLGIGLDSTMTD
jgi:hypothetical protein